MDHRYIRFEGKKPVIRECNPPAQKNYKDHNWNERCMNFIKPTLRCNSATDCCTKVHRMPREDDVFCKFYDLGSCAYTDQQCPFLHERQMENNDQINGYCLEESMASVLKRYSAPKKGG